MQNVREVHLYSLSLKGVYSKEYKSSSSVLIVGQSSGPAPWTIFLADFRLPPRADDPTLGGIPISMPLPADDMVRIQTDPVGKQALLWYADCYAARGQASANALKVHLETY